MAWVAGLWPKPAGKIGYTARLVRDSLPPARHNRKLPEELRRSLTWDRDTQALAFKAFATATDVAGSCLRLARLAVRRHVEYAAKRCGRGHFEVLRYPKATGSAVSITIGNSSLRAYFMLSTGKSA